MEQKTISIYGETYTMHLFLPEYVIECSIKQLKRIIKEEVTTEYDSHKLESNLEDMLSAARYGHTVASSRTRKQRMTRKVQLLCDAVNEYTERIEGYDN